MSKGRFSVPRWSPSQGRGPHLIELVLLPRHDIPGLHLDSRGPRPISFPIMYAKTGGSSIDFSFKHVTLACGKDEDESKPMSRWSFFLCSAHIV